MLDQNFEKGGPKMGREKGQTWNGFKFQLFDKHRGV